MTSCRGKECCQRPKTSWFDFVLPFAFQYEHRVENCFSFIVTFWFWVVSDLLGRHGNHKQQRFDFLIECKLNDGTFQFHCSHNENIKFSAWIRIQADGAFLKSFSISWITHEHPWKSLYCKYLMELVWGYILWGTYCFNGAKSLAHLFSKLSHNMLFQTMWYFDKCRLRRACAASF